MLNVEVQPDESIKCAISKELNRQAGKTAVDAYKLKRDSQGGIMTPPKESKPPLHKDIEDRTEEQLEKDKKEANTLIDYALKQLEILEEEKNKVASWSKGRSHHLD